MKSSVKTHINTNSCVYQPSATFVSTYGRAGGYTPAVSSIRGARIVELRLRAGFETQAELAAKAKIDPSKLSRVENDKPVNFTLDTLERLAKTLKVPVVELFTEPGQESDSRDEHLGNDSGGAGLADSLRRALHDYEATGQYPKDWRGDIMLAIFALTRALQQSAAPAESGRQDRKAQ